MAERKHCVYRHTSPTGKVYIGVTCIVPERRWENGHGYKYNSHFWNAIVKYGWDNFTHEIVCDELTREQAYLLEKELITLHRATDPHHGYNITEGGCGGLCGVKMSEETRQKKSESARRSWEKRRELYGHSERVRRVKKGHKKTPVAQYSFDGELCKVWGSMCEIERELGIPTGKISECCRGKRNFWKGYIWKFAEVSE